MSSYYANGDLDAYSARLANHELEHAAWQQQTDAAQAAYAAALAAWQPAHDAWAAIPEPRLDDGGQELVEPVAPQPPAPLPEPQPPGPPAVTYTTRELAEPEQLATPAGPALVLPPRLVVTGTNGATFALEQAELDAGYTPTTEPLPPARAEP
jgi:hypothetical protein